MRPPKVPDEDKGKLEPELERVRKRVGDANYAHATARDFAKGGKYNPKDKRARYAVT